MRLIKLPSSARVSPSTSPPAFLSLLLSLVLFAFLWVDVVSGAAVSEKLQSGSPTRDAVGTLKPSNLATSVSGGSTTPAQINTEHPKTTTSISSQNPVPTLTSDTISQDTDPNVSPVYSGFGLPIMPTITPGIAVTGVILLLAGLPYCLIGIKQKKVQIFLSVAYLCSLGVTVLIVYVMNPPVPDAVQGAYVVAAVITGLFFGAVAVIFPEVTEKLGCLLGGFCLSMWFLVLKPGGLIDNTYGKLIIIAAFSLTVFVLAFHRITKPYAIISACAFSGATSIVLGIDCFSRAGLKEFWLYIWDLNDSMFPLNTNTYPHTRGMRVEIAIILLITALGIMSQMKLWRILKERRDQKRAQKQKQQEDVERLDEDVGRRVQEEDSKARAQWEKIYGNAEASEKGSPRDSGVATSSNDSKIISMDEDRSRKELDTLSEQEETTKGNSANVDGKIAEEAIEHKGGEKQVNDAEPEPSSTELQPLPGEPVPTHEAGEGSIKHFEEPEASLPVEPSPSPPPLPPPVLFQHHTPYFPMEEEYDEDVMSLATYADTIAHDFCPKGLVKIDCEALEDASQHEDDAGIGKLSEPSKETLVAESFSGGEEGGIIVRPGEELQADFHTQEQPDVSKEFQSTNTTNEPQLANNSNELQETGSTSIEERKVSSTISGERRISSVNSGDKSISPPVSLSDLGALQNHCSRIHKTYRTNEWAKHLADAEVVELDDLSPYIEEGVPDEHPVPVLISQLQETAVPERKKSRGEPQEPPPSAQTPLSFAVATTTTTQHASSYLAPHAPPTVAVVPPSLATGVPSSLVSPPKAVLRQNSVSVIPEDVQQSVTPPPISRAVSPVPPISRAMSPTPPISRAMSPSPQIPYENTLIGRRESILKMRPSLLQEQMNRSASPSGFQSPLVMGDPVPTYNMNTSRLANTDDMPLSQRRELLLNHQVQQAGVQPQSRSQTPMPQLSPRSSFGLSPPSPTNPAAKQNQLLQSWRDSLKQDVQTSQTQWNERKALQTLNEKQQAAIYKREKEAERAQRDALVEERMRMPHMLNAHREALRKLQAAATTT